MPGLRRVTLLHASYYVALLAHANKQYEAGGDLALAGLRALDDDMPNIRLGQKHATDLTEYDRVALELACLYPAAGYQCLGLRLHPRDWVLWLTAGLEAARRLDERALERQHLGNLGAAWMAQSNHERALECFGRALELDRAALDREAESAGLNNLASVYLAMGDARQAIALLEQALALVRDIGDLRRQAAILGNLGAAKAALGEPRQAIELYNQQLGIAKQIGDLRSQSGALTNIAGAWADLGELGTFIR